MGKPYANDNPKDFDTLWALAQAALMEALAEGDSREADEEALILMDELEALGLDACAMLD